MRPRPIAHDRFDIYKSILILSPSRPHVHNSQRLRRLRAFPSQKSKNPRLPPTPAHFDTALVIEDPEKYRRDGGLNGLRVAEIRVIFTLPAHLGHITEPLLYVHWFRPLTTIDARTGMYSLCRATHQLQPKSAIVRASQVLRGCHLIPKIMDGPVSAEWTSENVMTKATDFFLNSHFDFYIFEDMRQRIRAS
ncbi:hypothetical protein PLICRDRAFT_104706 [Plicaturopsis crispa FD-325 SS-3]|nr:hypothetical protein PLICRDRAFT_104706 [Plicaturopsis crispa FD-325 SS-3]